MAWIKGVAVGYKKKMMLSKCVFGIESKHFLLNL